MTRVAVAEARHVVTLSVEEVNVVLLPGSEKERLDFDEERLEVFVSLSRSCDRSETLEIDTLVAQ